MISPQKFSGYKLLFLIAILTIASFTLQGQNRLERNDAAVIELKNFSEEKMLPVLNQLLNKNSGLKIQGYCLGQDLVVFTFDEKKFATSKDVSIFLEDNGYIAYLKENMNSLDVIANCKSPYKKSIEKVKL